MESFQLVPPLNGVQSCSLLSEVTLLLFQSRSVPQSLDKTTNHLIRLCVIYDLQFFSSNYFIMTNIIQHTYCRKLFH